MEDSSIAARRARIYWAGLMVFTGRAMCMAGWFEELVAQGVQNHFV